MIHSIYHNPDSISTENRLSAMLDGAKIFIYIRFELLAFYLWSGTIPQNKIRIRMLIYQLPEFFVSNMKILRRFLYRKRILSPNWNT